LIVAKLLFLQFEDPKSDIHLYINSPGGSVTAGMGIYDTMQYHLRRGHLLHRPVCQHGGGPALCRREGSETRCPTVA
jgi:hypothetical protein